MATFREFASSRVREFAAELNPLVGLHALKNLGRRPADNRNCAQSEPPPPETIGSRFGPRVYLDRDYAVTRTRVVQEIAYSVSSFFPSMFTLPRSISSWVQNSKTNSPATCCSSSSSSSSSVLLDWCTAAAVASPIFSRTSTEPRNATNALHFYSLLYIPFHWILCHAYYEPPQSGNSYFFVLMDCIEYINPTSHYSIHLYEPFQRFFFISLHSISDLFYLISERFEWLSQSRLVDVARDVSSGGHLSTNVWKTISGEFQWLAQLICRQKNYVNAEIFIPSSTPKFQRHYVDEWQNVGLFSTFKNQRSKMYSKQQW